MIRAAALGDELPYCERWFMYVEDMDLCWRLAQKGWRRRLEPGAGVVHVGNAAGAQAWGEMRTARWWEATYDWYRFRRGEAAVRRYAVVNTLGVQLLLLRARLFRKDRADLEQILPTHRAMARNPAGAFIPPPNDGSTIGDPR